MSVVDQLIPDYDIQKINADKRTELTTAMQGYTSDLLNLRVAFYWRPLANDNLINTFRQWNTPPYITTPDYIIIGIIKANLNWYNIITGLVFNHMHEKNGNNYKLFANGLTQLKPILRKLSNVTRIVWLQQAPILHSAKDMYRKPFFTAKLPHYNAAMRSILKSVYITRVHKQEEPLISSDLQR